MIEVVPLEGGTFSAQLVPQIAALLAKHGFSKTDIGGFAVVSGPGSFTGVRVGLAAIKALAEVLQKPIAAVSLLEAIAVSGGAQGRVIAVLDAGRGEVYAGEYEVHGDGARLLQRAVADPRRIAGGGDGIDRRDSGPRPGRCGPQRAACRWKRLNFRARDVIARLGWQKIHAGEIVSPEALEANYIRRSSEIFSKSSS